MTRTRTLIYIAAILTSGAFLSGAEETVKVWDFSQGVHGWQPNPRVAKLASEAEGMVLNCTGLDPWITSPPFDCPLGKTLFVTVRLKATKDAMGEVFYGRHIRAGHSTQFPIRGDGKWHDYRLYVADELGSGTRLRLDPGTKAGIRHLASIRVTALAKAQPPELAAPGLPGTHGSETGRVTSGNVSFVQYGKTWGAFAIEVDKKTMASGYDADLLGLWENEKPVWKPLREAKTKVRQQADTLIVETMIPTDDGKHWILTRTIKPGAVPGSLSVKTALRANQDGKVGHLPWLTLLPGLGTFGPRKTQAVFSGIEYLCDEPSSSEADVSAPKNVRRIPAPKKLAFPLMAIAHEDRYIGLVWNRSKSVAPLFDSPDRTLGSKAHAMALVGPGVGAQRLENHLFAHSPIRIEAGQTLSVTATIIGGHGQTIVPALKQYVALKGLPPIPKYDGGFPAAMQLLSHGWLDSDCNMEGVFRHAVWGDKFMNKAPAAEAIMFIDWLAQQAENPLADRLGKLRDLALSKHPENAPFDGRISHANLKTAPFVFGRLPEFAKRQIRQARNQLKGYDENGIKTYHPHPKRKDYSRTHFAKHANGLAAGGVANILYAASLCADKTLRKQALDLLDKQTALYANTVPRGAQTWEVPLHTPDILASGHLVQAYVYGYLLSDDQAYLEQARYWAWSGIPFVYLEPPTSPEKTGTYATTAVLGATNWQAPYWIGLPVQWCGLKYADALHQLADCDNDSLWGEIAKGITVTGLRMSWNTSDKERQGLLPDYFQLDGQMSAGPAINPGTVQSRLPELYDKGTLYAVKRIPETELLLHAPCAIRGLRNNNGSIEFQLDGWGKRPYRILIAGLVSPHGKLRFQGRTETRWRALTDQEITVDAELGFSTLKLPEPGEISLMLK